MVALLVDHTPEAERGLAIGTLSGSWDVGVVIGSLIIGVTVERVSRAPRAKPWAAATRTPSPPQPSPSEIDQIRQALDMQITRAQHPA